MKAINSRRFRSTNQAPLRIREGPRKSSRSESNWVWAGVPVPLDISRAICTRGS